MTILCSDYARISLDILGLSSNRLSIGGSIQGVSAEILSFKISCQAQYLVRLEGDFTCSAHWKWRFICDADQWWHSFCVAGAVFGEVRVGLFVAGAALRDILGDSRDAKCCILQYKIVSKMRRVRSPKRRVRDDDFILGLCSDIVGYPRIVFLLAEAFREFPLKSWASRFRGRRSIWWGWRVTWLAPRIGNDVSYAMRMKDAIHLRGRRSICWVLYCVYIPPKNEYICCHLPICSPNNVPQTHYPLEDGSLVTHATSWNARMQ